MDPRSWIAKQNNQAGIPAVVRQPECHQHDKLKRIGMGAQRFVQMLATLMDAAVIVDPIQYQRRHLRPLSAACVSRRPICGYRTDYPGPHSHRVAAMTRELRAQCHSPLS
jgi:hypothetical protein